MLRLFLLVVGLSVTPAAPEATFTLDNAWTWALERNQSLLAAALEVPEADVLRLAASLWPNPETEYSVANLVLGAGNDQERDLHPTLFEQTIQQVAIRQVLDVWGKRRAHVAAAQQGVDAARWRTTDALRVVHQAIAWRFVALAREQEEYALAQNSRQRYDQTVALTRKRFDAGDIAASELRVIELEGLQYANAEEDAVLELRLARQDLAQMLGLPDGDALPGQAASFAAPPARPQASLGALLQDAWRRRPDLLAARAAVRQANLNTVAASRDAFAEPALQLGYARSKFQISGDNPHTLSLAIALPLPLFDRNQAGRAQARLDARRAALACDTLKLDIAHEVGAALRQVERAQAILARYEAGGMRDKAEASLRVAEKSYRAGALSYLEMLEAERTFLTIQAHFIATRHDFWQAHMDLMHAIAEERPE